jgi:hypothetical protein
VTSTTGDRVDEAVAHVVGAAEMVDQELTTVDDMNLDEAARQLFRIRSARAKLQRCEAALERHIAGIFRADRLDRYEALGIGVVEVRYGKPRTAWDHEALAKAWLEAWLPAYQGEIPPPWDVRDGLLEVAAVSYWRATPLRALGIDPDEYCESRPAQARVQITGSGAAL